MRRRAGEVHSAALKLDEEQYVVAAQERRLDGEEVTGDDAGGLCSQELPPARPRASRRRSKASAREQATNCARRDREAELRELAGDALVAPALVLAREPQHELTSLGRDRRAARAAARECPPSPHELAVPAQQGLRRDEQTMAARRREQPAHRGEEGAVTRSQPWALDLAAQDIELMAQHDQLDVLDPRGPAAANQQPQQRDEDQVDEREEHRAMLPEPVRRPRSGQIRVLAPFRSRMSLRIWPRRPAKSDQNGSGARALSSMPPA